MKILKYVLTRDKKSLIEHYEYEGKKNLYRIHPDDLTTLEKWIKKLLIEKDKEKR